jgi:hypothetical protein
MGAPVTASTRQPVPEVARESLLPVAQRVFWWGQAEQWLDDTGRFVAQVMTYGDWDDTSLALGLLGDEVFQEVLKAPPSRSLRRQVLDILALPLWAGRPATAGARNLNRCSTLA